MVLRLLCTYGWMKHAAPHDSDGKMLEILKGIHESTFKDHYCKIE